MTKMTDEIKCERCGDNLQDHNEYFFRCPQCALLKQKEKSIEWEGEAESEGTILE